MGWFDDVCDTVSDGVDAVGDAAGDVAGAAVDLVEGAGDAAADAAGVAGDLFGGAYDAAASAAEGMADAAVDGADWFAGAAGSALQGAADAGDWFLNTTDDYVFDPVDTLTGGIVDIDYDDGTFSAAVGIDGLANVGFAVGEHGFDVGADTVVGGANLGFGDDGFHLGGHVLGDWSPYNAAANIDVSADGDVNIGASGEAILPTPVGLLDVGGSGSFVRNSDGSWGVQGEASGELYTPTGVTVGADVHAGYAESADGDSTFNVGGGANIGYVGVGSVEAGVDYTHSEIDGVTTDSVDVNAGAEAMGVGVEVNAGYERQEDADGNVTTTLDGGAEVDAFGAAAGVDGSVSFNPDGSTTTSSDAWTDVDGFDSGALLSAATQVAGDQLGFDGGEIVDDIGIAQDVGQTVSDLAGSGDLSDVLGVMADQAGASVADVAGGLADSGNFDAFTSDIVSTEVTEAEADDLFDGLDP